MGAGINRKYIDELVKEAIYFAKNSKQITDGNPRAVADFIFSILMMAAGFVPVVGPELTMFGNLLYGLIYPTNSREMWQDFLKEVDSLIQARITEKEVKDLTAYIIGLQNNMEAYTKAVRNYQETPNDATREQVRTIHTALLVNIRGQIPRFQEEKYEAVALPFFAIAANTHLLLLVDGVNNGTQWGFDSSTVAALREEFNARVGKAKPAEATEQHTRRRLAELELAIRVAPEAATPEETVRAFRAEREALAEPGAHPVRPAVRIAEDAPDPGNYPAWVLYCSNIGGQAATLSDDSISYPNTDIGGPEGSFQKGKWDYASDVVIQALNFADLWPFLLDKASGNDDIPRRGLCYGSLGRGTGNMPVLLTDHEDDSRFYGRTDQLPFAARMSSVRIWGLDDAVQPLCDLTSLETRTSDGTVLADGHPEDYAVARRLVLKNDEWITRAEVWYGYKVGRVELTTNKGKTAHAGTRKDSEKDGKEGHFVYEFPGHRLSYLASTQYCAHPPEGIEGLVLGWWRLAFDDFPFSPSTVVPDVLNPGNFWVFQGTRYRIINIDKGGKVTSRGDWKEVTDNWPSLGGRYPDCAFPDVENPGSYYVFSGDQYISIAVDAEGKDSKNNEWKPSEDHWPSLAAPSDLHFPSAAMSNPWKPGEYFLFTPYEYICISIDAQGNDTKNNDWKSTADYWPSLEGKYPDALMPDPWNTGEVYVFSEGQYKKIKISKVGENDEDTSLCPWQPIEGNWPAFDE